MRYLVLLLMVKMAFPLHAETVVATRTLPARSIILSADIELVDGTVAGHASRIDQVLGMETSVAIYAGRPMPLAQLLPPAIIERNQMIKLVFQAAGLSIETDGRALERGGIGSRVRVMNLASRNTVFGVILDDGNVYVGVLQ